MRMKYCIYLFIILNLVYSCKPPKPPLQPSGVKSAVPDLFPTEKDYPKEMRITGKYTFKKNNKNFHFKSKDLDSYCYDLGDNKYLDEDLIPIRFRLYDQDNKLLHERLPVISTSKRSSIIRSKERLNRYPPDIRSLYFAQDQIEKMKEIIATVWTDIPYHKEGVKIKAILVDDTGKDVEVLAERGILPPEEFRERFFYQGCYRQVGFGIE